MQHRWSAALRVVLGVGLLLSGVSAVGPASAADPEAPVVKAADGVIRGLTSSKVDSFLGIPFAAPPVGELRWRPPAPAAPWHGVRNAITDPPGCPQNEGGLLPGVGSSTEDCLYLSVYRPAGSNTQTRLPVLFWMHGGGFGSGAGWLYDGSTLAQRNDVVVVTINYRLGALGYLTSPALDAEQGNSGNYGFLDQIAALKWVHRNITAFGGDPSRVAISGQSAGGGSACAMLASPQAKGLFSSAIIQSGGDCLTAPKSTVAAGDQALAPAAGCTTGDAAAQLSCLRSKSAAEVLAASNQARAARWQPVVGGNALPIEPLTAVKAGTWNRVPVLMGAARDEGRAGIGYLGVRYPAAEAVYQDRVRAFFGGQR